MRQHAWLWLAWLWLAAVSLEKVFANFPAPPLFVLKNGRLSVGMIPSLIIALIATAALAQAGQVTIHVEGVKDSVGKVAVLLFADANGFPNESAKAAYKTQVNSQAGTTKITLADVKPGRYAVCVIHDENVNALLDRSFFGIPTEGVAISNGIRREKPTFEKAAIEITADGSVTLSLKYW
jgi:uncharacterized protein (DUF2141 family)